MFVFRDFYKVRSSRLRVWKINRRIIQQSSILKN